jgi:hypothetical protein
MMVDIISMMELKLDVLSYLLDRLKAKAILSLFTIGLSLTTSCMANPPLQKISSLGKLKVGQLLPSYGGVSASGRAMGRVPSKGSFLIHLLHPELPTTCVDEECGKIGSLVQSYGGQLYGGSDRKLAGAVFDILPSPSSSKNIDEYGVLIVSSSGGKVLSIYNHATPNSVSTVLKSFKQP